MPPKSSRKTSKGIATSTSTSHVPPKKRSRQPAIPSLPWHMRDEAMRSRYLVLVKRPLLCTRYIDEAAIDLLGITNQIHQLLTNIGWVDFVSRRPPTYVELTLEFLSSLLCDLNKYDTESHGRIQFRLMGREYVMNILEFNELFGFHTDGVQMLPTNFDIQAAWTELSGGQSQYNSSLSRATQLLNPALKYLHRFMAHSVFGRSATNGVVSKKEVYLLWAMHHGVRVNTGHWIMDYMQHVARQTSGKICIGGLVTMIVMAIGLQIDPSIHTQVQGQQSIDINMLINMRLCKQVRGRYQLIQEPLQDAPNELQESQPMPASPPDLEVSHGSSPPEQPPSQQPPLTLEMVMAKMSEMHTETLARFDKLSNDLIEYQKATDYRFTALEDRLDQIADDSASDVDI